MATSPLRPFIGGDTPVTPFIGSTLSVDPTQEQYRLDAASGNSFTNAYTAARVNEEANLLAAQESALRAQGTPQALAQAQGLRGNIGLLQQRAGAYATPVPTIDDVNWDPLRFGSYIAGQAGTGVGSMQTQLVQGSAMNAAATGLGLIKHPIAQLASKGLRWAAPAVAYKQNADMLTGEAYNEVVRDPLAMQRSAQEIDDTVRAHGYRAAVTDTMVPGLIAGQLGGNGLKALTRKIGPKTLLGGELLVEGAGETLQGKSQQYAHGLLNPERDTSGDFKEDYNNFLGGVFGAAGPATAGHYASKAFDRASGDAGNPNSEPGTTQDLGGSRSPAGPRGPRSPLTPEDAAVINQSDTDFSDEIKGMSPGAAKDAKISEWFDQMDTQKAAVAQRVLTPLAAKDPTAARALEKLAAGDPDMAIAHVQRLHQDAEDAASLGTQFTVHGGGGKKNAQVNNDGFVIGQGSAENDNRQKWNSPLPDARTQDGDKPLLEDDDAFNQWQLRMKDEKKRDAANKALPPESFAATDWTPEERRAGAWRKRSIANPDVWTKEEIDQAKLMGQITQQAAEAAHNNEAAEPHMVEMHRTLKEAGVVPLMRDLGYEIAAMVRSAGLNTDEGPVAPVAKDQNAFDAMKLRISSIANSLRIGLKEHAQEALDQMGTVASAESKPVFDAIATQLASQKTPEGREALKQARWQAQDELLRAIPANDKLKLRAEGIDLGHHESRTQLLQMMELQARGQLAAEIRSGLTRMLGHNTFNKLVRTLNIGVGEQQEGDELLNDAGTNPNAIAGEDDEQGGEHKQGSLEANDAERVASAVGEPFYGYARSGSSLDMKKGAFLADTMSASERNKRMQSNRDRAIAGEAQQPTTRHPGLFRVNEKGEPTELVDTPKHAKDTIMSRVIRDMETKLGVDRTPENMMRILKEEGNDAAIDFVKQLQADGSPESQARLADLQKSFFENRAGGHRVVSKPVMELLHAQGTPDERLLSLHHAYLHQNAELETSQAEKIRNTDPEAYAKAMARVEGHRAQIPKTLAALLDLTDRKGKNGKPAGRVTTQERGDAIKAAKKYFTEHHVVVGEELTNRDNDRISPTEIIRMADVGDRAISHLRVSGKNVSDINILTFQSAGSKERSISRHPKGTEYKDKDGKVYMATKPGEIHIPAGKLVEWAMQRRGERTASDTEGDRKKAKFDAHTQNKEYLDLLMEGIAAMRGSGYVTDALPTKVNAEGRKESFGDQKQELIDAAKAKELLFRNLEASGAPKDKQDEAYEAWRKAEVQVRQDVHAAPPSLMLHNSTYKDYAFGKSKRKSEPGQGGGKYTDRQVLVIAKAMEKLTPETMTDQERRVYETLTARVEEARASGDDALEMRALHKLNELRFRMATKPERLAAVKGEVDAELQAEQDMKDANQRSQERMSDRLDVLKGELNLARKDVAKATGELRRMMDDGVRGKAFLATNKALRVAEANQAQAQKDITSVTSRLDQAKKASEAHAKALEERVAAARETTGIAEDENENVDLEMGREEKIYVPEQRTEVPRSEGLKEGEYVRKHWLSIRERALFRLTMKRSGRAAAEALIPKLADKHTAKYLASGAVEEDPEYVKQSTPEGQARTREELVDDFRAWWLEQYELHGSEGMLTYDKADRPMYARAIEARTPRDRKDNKDVPRPGESKSEDRLAGVKDADGVWTPVGKDNIDRSGRTVSTLHVDRSGTTYGEAKTGNPDLTPLDVAKGQDKRNEADEFTAQTDFSAKTGSDAGTNVRTEVKKTAVAMARANAEETLAALDSSIDRGIQMLRARLRMAQTAAYHDAAKLGITKQQAMNMATGGTHYALPAAYILTEERIAELAEAGATNNQLRELDALRVETARTLLDGENFKMGKPERIAATRLLQGFSATDGRINTTNVLTTLVDIVGGAEPMDLSGGYVPGKDTKAQLKANSDAAMTAYQAQLSENEAALREGRMPREVLFSALRAPAAPVADLTKTPLTGTTAQPGEYTSRPANEAIVAKRVAKAARLFQNVARPGEAQDDTTVAQGRTPLMNAKGETWTEDQVTKHTERTTELAEEGERVIARLVAKARGEVVDEAPQAKTDEVGYSSVRVANQSLSSVVDELTHQQVMWAINHREELIAGTNKETAFKSMLRGELALLNARLEALAAQAKAERQAGLTPEQKAKADKAAALVGTKSDVVNETAAKLKGTTYQNASGGTSTFGDKPAPKVAPTGKHHANVAMSYPMGNGDLIGALRGKYPNGTTTKELMANGDRTATTRSYALGAVGDTFDVGDGNVYRITGVRKLDLSTPVAQGTWSKLEGWNFKAVQAKFGNQVKTGAIQTTFEKVKTGQSVVTAVREEAQKPVAKTEGTTANPIIGDIWDQDGFKIVTTNLGGVHGRGLAMQARGKGLVTQRSNRNFDESPFAKGVITLAVKGREPGTARVPGQAFSEQTTGKNVEMLSEEVDKLIDYARKNPGKKFFMPFAGLGFGEGSAADIMPILDRAAAEPNIFMVTKDKATVDKYAGSFVPGARRDGTTRVAQGGLLTNPPTAPTAHQAKETAKLGGADLILAPISTPGYAGDLGRAAQAEGKLLVKVTPDVAGKVVLVSVPGANRGFTAMPALISRVLKALDNGATVRTDNQANAERTHNKDGEGALRAALLAGGYVETAGKDFSSWVAQAPKAEAPKTSPAAMVAKRQEYLDNPPSDYEPAQARSILDWAGKQLERVNAELEKLKGKGDHDREDQVADLRHALLRLQKKAQSVIEGDESLEGEAPKAEAPKAEAPKTEAPKTVMANPTAPVAKANSVVTAVREGAKAPPSSDTVPEPLADVNYEALQAVSTDGYSLNAMLGRAGAVDLRIKGGANFPSFPINSPEPGPYKGTMVNLLADLADGSYGTALGGLGLWASPEDMAVARSLLPVIKRYSRLTSAITRGDTRTAEVIKEFVAVRHQIQNTLLPIVNKYARSSVDRELEVAPLRILKGGVSREQFDEKYNAHLSGAENGKRNAQATSTTAPVNDPLVSGPLRPGNNDEIEQAKAWAKKTLADNIKVVFEDITGYSGQWLSAERVIEIARNAASGVMGAMHHEGLHAFFTDFIAANPQAKVMFNAITQNKELRERVYALLDGYPEAQADMMRDPEEMLAYTFQFWKAGALELPYGRSKTFFQKLVKLFRRVLGAVNDFERATDVLVAFDRGSFKTQDAGRAVLAGLMGQGTWTLKARRDLDRISQRLGALVMPTEEIYATSDSETARKLGHLWFTNPGDETTGGMKEGYLGAKKHMANKFVNAIARSMQEFNELDRAAVAKYMQAETPTDKIPYAPHRVAVEEIRATMDTIYKYAKGRGIQMDYAGKQGYYPVVWSTGALEDKKDAFVEMLMQPKYQDKMQEIMVSAKLGSPKAAAEEVFSWLLAREGMADKFEVKDGSDGVLTPYFANEEKRTLNWIEAADREPFLNKDLVSTLSKYTNNVVHAAEYTHRFGRDGEGLKKLMRQVTSEIYDASKKRMANGEFKDDKARIAWAGRQIRDIEAANGAMEGSLGNDVSSRVRKLNSYIMVYQNFRLLATTLFASFADPMGMVANGATMQQAYKAWLGAMREVIHDWLNMFRTEKVKYPENYFMKLAQMTGAIEHAIISHHVAEENSASFMDRTSKKLNNALFKANGMEAFDRGMRAGAMEAAYYFLLHHKGLPEKHSKRWLANLGLTSDQIHVNGDGRLIVAPGDLLDMRGQERDETNMDKARKEIAVVHGALNRWVESAILSPSAAARPAWASDPHYASLFHLKQFTYTWHQTIRKHALQEYDHGNLAPMGALAGMVPILMASNIMKGLFVGGGTLPTHLQGMSFANHVENAVQNAGLGGVHQMGLDNLMNPTKLGGPMIEQVTGWFLNDKTLGQNVLNAMPLQQLTKGFAGP